MWRSIAAIVTTLILIPLLFIAFACSADDNNGQMTGAEQDSMKTGEAAAQQVTVKTDESATDQSAVKTGENTTNTFDRAKLGTVERDIVYGTGGGVQLKMDIYYPKKLDGLAPATLVIVKNAGHGFAPQGGAISPSLPELNRMIVDFFRRELELQ